VEADSTNGFKSRLDKYWTNQDVIYDDCDLTGTGGLPVCNSVCNILSFWMRAKRLHLRPPYHIGLDWIGFASDMEDSAAEAIGYVLNRPSVRCPFVRQHLFRVAPYLRSY